MARLTWEERAAIKVVRERQVARGKKVKAALKATPGAFDELMAFIELYGPETVLGWARAGQRSAESVVSRFEAAE